MSARGKGDSSTPLVEPLTRREQDILELLAEGLTSSEMAGRLTLAVSSVRWYVQQIYGKLGVNGKRQAVSRAGQLGLLRSVPANFVTIPIPSSPALTHPHNLPVQRTSFIGRQAQVIQVKELLRLHALVTLTGSGGVGKTRLCLRAAEELLEQFTDGVWLVELAAVTDPTLVTQTVASNLGLKSAGSQPIHQILLDYLHGKQALLVLDNCEHLIKACAALVDDLLKTCRGVKILASSREALGVSGEIPFRVPSMTLPDLSNMPELTEMEQFEAVRLFNERVRVTRPDFQISIQNAVDVAKICQRLDGIPLAIELAAARLNILNTEQLIQNLDNAFRLLSGGARTALPRQQTLRATIDWSFRLLSQQEQGLLRRLSVFTGSFDLLAVEAVCCLETAEKMDVLDALASLVNKSMLLVEPQPDQEMRYRLLETLRQYALEKLSDSGEGLRLHDLHAGYYLDLVKLDGPNDVTRQTPAWLRQVDMDSPNIRAAMMWALESRAPEQAIAALLPLWWYWFSRGIYEEGQSLLEKALSCVDTEQPSLARAGLMCNLGFLGMLLDSSSRKDHEILMASREMFRELGDRNGYAWSSMWLSFVENQDRYVQESAAIFKELGDDKCLAYSLMMWGNITRDAGDLEQAEFHMKESERLYRNMGARWRLGEILRELGFVNFLKGQLQQARSLNMQAFPLLREVDDQWGLMWANYYKGWMEIDESVDDETNLYDAEATLLESLKTARKFGNKFWLTIQIPTMLARISQKRGEFSQAVARIRQTLTLLLDFGTNSLKDNFAYTGQCLLGLAEAAVSQDNPDYSARLLGALDGLGELEKVVWRDIKPENVQRVSDLTHSRLTDTDFQAAWAEGRSMTLEQAIALGLEEHA